MGEALPDGWVRYSLCPSTPLRAVPLPVSGRN